MGWLQVETGTSRSWSVDIDAGTGARPSATSEVQMHFRYSLHTGQELANALPGAAPLQHAAQDVQIHTVHQASGKYCRAHCKPKISVVSRQKRKRPEPVGAFTDSVGVSSRQQPLT